MARRGSHVEPTSKGRALAADQPVLAGVEWLQAAGSIAVACRVGVNRAALTIAGAGTVALAVAHVFEGAAAVSAVVAVFAVRVPQLWQLRSPAAHAMSVSAWAMSAVSNVLWVGWAVTGDHPAMILGAGVSAVSSAAIALVARRRAPHCAELAPAHSG